MKKIIKTVALWGLVVYSAALSTFTFYKFAVFQEGFWPWFTETTDVINLLLERVGLSAGVI